MVYVDWYYEKAKKEKRVFEEKKSNYKYWEDLVTQTQYCISEEDYERICKAAKKMLEQYTKEKNLKEIEQFFYDSKGNDDVNLFPYLPSFAENTIKCARICDYVCFRTACLYALKYDSIRDSSNIEEEKRDIRIQGLTWGYVDCQEESVELEQIDQMINRKNNNNSLLECKADFVKGGMIKIKQYYLETNKIPEIRGASLLLHTVSTEKIEEIICQEHIRECLIYTGGGKMMGIFPEGSGEDICKRIGLMVEEEAVTAQFNFYSHPYKLMRLINEYKKVTEEMDLLLEGHQNLRWDFRIEPQVAMEIIEEKIADGRFRKLVQERSEICTSCRNRYAIVYEREEDKLCPSCLYKKLKGGKNARRSKYQEYRKYVKKKYGKEIPDSGNSYNKLEDIAENGFIGVIYGDANSMSSQINNLESFMMMRYFSEITEDTVTDIVFDALFQHLKDKSSFEVIAVGGDDIFLIVPGKYAYDIACTIGELFDQSFQNRSISENKMTMSVGVCITHDKMPVQYSFEIAQELLKSAKQKAWEERQRGNITGTIDWMAIENEATGSAVLEYQRRKEDGKPEKTLRPYTWSQAKAMKNFQKQIEKEKSFAFQLRQSFYQHTKEEAELFFEYQITRKKETDICYALECLAKKLGGVVVKNNIVYQEKEYSPWLDIVELWDYMED